MCKVSVIMPVYNSQKYLETAINSVLEQSFKDIELILVDDGSKDDSGRICDEYLVKDERIRVYHNENQGICATRNFAIEKAKGEYLLFIDNDDELIPGMIEENYRLAQNNNADIVKFGCDIDESFKSGFVQKRGNYFTESFVFSKDQAPKYYGRLKYERYFSYIWNGMYRREFLIKNSLLFNTDIKCGYEDRILNYAMYPLAEIQVINKNAGYKYYQRYEHSTFKKFNKNQLYSCLISAKKEYQIYDMYKESPVFNEKWVECAAEYLIELLFTFGKYECDMSFSEKKQYVDYLRKQKVFKVLSKSSELSTLSKKRQSVVKLFVKKRNTSLLLLCAFYLKIIYLKRIIKNRSRK